MELYEQKSRWKLYLAIAAFIIIGASMIYTNYVANRLADGERDKVQLFAQALSQIAAPDSTNIDPDASPNDVDLTMALQVMQTVEDIPVILVDEGGQITEIHNFSDNADMEAELAAIKENGYPPIEGQGYARYVYYKNTFTLTLLSYFPLFQILLLLIFVGVGYIGFSNARNAEQNRVWAGMAKETAHQLGTPISAIIAWLEHLKLMKGEDEETMEIVGELENDVSRLNLIADRFSKIGSEPKLDAINVYEELEKCRVYMQRRAPRKVSFEFPDPNHTPLTVAINPPLFDWVIENLLRNALDAMDGKGKITAHIYDDNQFINIDITDTGKGIPANKLKTVFQPGYTTKKRGWGLGLSLAKRIIESYHSGRIFVKKSIVNEGTTFTIKLPKSVVGDST